jgi:hypothetical protein
VAAERIARNTPGFQPVLGRKVRGFRGIKPSDTSHKRRPTREALVNAVLSGPRGDRTHNPRIIIGSWHDTAGPSTWTYTDGYLCPHLLLRLRRAAFRVTNHVTATMCGEHERPPEGPATVKIGPEDHGGHGAFSAALRFSSVDSDPTNHPTPAPTKIVDTARVHASDDPVCRCHTRRTHPGVRRPA